MKIDVIKLQIVFEAKKLTLSIEFEFVLLKGTIHILCQALEGKIFEAKTVTRAGQTSLNEPDVIYGRPPKGFYNI